jgi:hypothetical protein
MHDERPPPLRAQITFQLVVYGRFRALSWQRYRQQSCGLVDHQQHAVFIKDVERRDAAARGAREPRVRRLVDTRPSEVPALLRERLLRRAAAPIRRK